MKQTDFFPVVSSILAGDALAERILPHYGPAGTGHCSLLNHGDNDTYLVQQDQNKFILRVWSKDDRARAEIEAEVELLDFLARHAVPVARPHKRLDGAFLSEVQAPEGKRFIGLFAHAPGATPGYEITPEQSVRYGQAVAALHRAFDQVTTPYPRPRWDLTRLLETPLSTIRPLLAQRPTEQQYLTELAATLTAQMARLPQTPPLYGLCHGDLHKNNLLWSADQQLTLLDFDLCGYGWRVYDLAILFWSTQYLPQAQAVRAAYLAGYNEIRVLQPLEMELLPYFVAIREMYILQVRLRHALRGVSGSPRVDDAFFQERIEFLRQWMAAIQNNTYWAL